MSSYSSSSYYDIDAILAEEELIPVSNQINFSYLAHLDPDYVHHRPTLTHSKAKKSTSASSISTSLSSTNSLTQSSMTSSQSSINSNNQPNTRKRRTTSSSSSLTSHHHLPENTTFKMPLWSIHKWAELNFIRLSLPRHYNRKGREKLETDPIHINLRQKSEHYYMAGLALINTIYHTIQSFDRQSKRNNNNSTHTNTQRFMNRLHNESQELKRTILLTYTGARLRTILDWTMSSNTEDDVSAYTKKLTEMERRLFRCSADASYAFMMWKLHGSHRIVVSDMALRSKVMSVNTSIQNGNVPRKSSVMTKGAREEKGFGSARLVSPVNHEGNNFGHSRKRMRSY